MFPFVVENEIDVILGFVAIIASLLPLHMLLIELHEVVVANSTHNHHPTTTFASGCIFFRFPSLLVVIPVTIYSSPKISSDRSSTQHHGPSIGSISL
jgi:hypothetical protein